MKLILEAIKALFRKTENSIAKRASFLYECITNAQTTADNAQTTADNAQTTADNARTTKMDKENPTGSGSFGMNLVSDRTVGNFSFAEGYDTNPAGNYSHAEGHSNRATGTGSHVEGYVLPSHGIVGYISNLASGDASHAEGSCTTASGSASHAEGGVTTASGALSHAEGQNTTASGVASHAEGWNTTASGKYQHVQGKYNIADTENKYAHIVGNGGDPGDGTGVTYSNAHTLDWEGNAWFAGTVKGTALILPSSTEGSTKRFKITVDDTGTLTATEITE